jgi:hypothetical protein
VVKKVVDDEPLEDELGVELDTEVVFDTDVVIDGVVVVAVVSVDVVLRDVGVVTTVDATLDIKLLTDPLARTCLP